MSDCNFEGLIDAYLLDKLSEDEKVKFEEHYFNCPSCFQKMKEKDEMISAIKWKGERIFADLIHEEQVRKASLWDRLVGFMTPRQWAAIAAAAALVLVVVTALIPRFTSQAPQFTLDDFTLRGQSITLISDSIPGRFQWQPVENAAEYKITIENHEPLWRDTTTDNFIVLPDEIKSKMKPGINYFWQVKAFSAQGTLIAESSKIRFSIPD